MNITNRSAEQSRVPRGQFGVALIEALVALLIMTFGMIALAGLQGTMRRSADLAKQRGEAVRLAQSEMEILRDYSVLPASSDPNIRSYADIATTTPNLNAGLSDSNTSFALTRTVTAWPPQAAAIADWVEPQQRAVNIRVQWMDRAGSSQFVVIDSFIAGADPSLSGSLRWAPASAPLRRPGGRDVSIPIGAKDLGQGTSAFVPGPNATVAWIFNNLSGLIVGRCTVAMGTQSSSLTSSGLADCVDTNGFLLSGFVRFSFGNTPNPSAPNSPALPQLGFEIVQASPQPQPPLPSGVSPGTVPAPPSHQCFNDSPDTDQVNRPYVSYYCVVFPSNDVKPRWSGKLNMTGVGNAYKVCRYSADYNGDGKILNAEHPLNYCAVTKAITKQNFLVISASASCPAGHAIDQARGFFSNSMTVAHEVENRTVPYPAVYDASLIEDVCGGRSN